MKKFFTALATVAALTVGLAGPAAASSTTVYTSNGYLPASACKLKSFSWSVANKGTNSYDMFMYVYDATGRKVGSATQTGHTVFSGTKSISVCSTMRPGTWTVRMDVDYLDRNYNEYVGWGETVRRTFTMKRAS